MDITSRVGVSLFLFFSFVLDDRLYGLIWKVDL